MNIFNDFPFYHDESYELVKVALFQQGIDISEVWTDQPWGFNFLLYWLGIDTLVEGRLLVLGFAIVAVVAFWWLVKHKSSAAVAYLCCIGLVSSYKFIWLSTILMKEIPSLSLLLVSLALVAYRRNWASAIVFVGSLWIKQSGLFLIPVWFMCRGKFRADGILIIAGAIVSAVVSYPSTHLKAVGYSWGWDYSIIHLGDVLIHQNPLFIAFGLLSIAGCIWHKEYPPVVWFLISLIRFSLITPVWEHYTPHLMIPLFWMISILLTKVPRLTRVFTIVLVAQCILNIALYEPRFSIYHPVTQIMEQNQGSSIITDYPYLIHKYKMVTPPETAILSLKRVNTYQLDTEFIDTIAMENKPDFMFFFRFPQLVGNYEGYQRYRFESGGDFYIREAL